jgi:hypothetical protein
MTADNTGRSRRDFFYLAGALAIGTASGQSRIKIVEPESPQIGILLATTFTTGTLEARLAAAKANGLACVQMSMAAAGLPEMPDQIPAELPDRMRRESSARGIVIASMTGTFNMTHPDEEHRRDLVQTLRRRTISRGRILGSVRRRAQPPRCLEQFWVCPAAFPF